MEQSLWRHNRNAQNTLLPDYFFINTRLKLLLCQLFWKNIWDLSFLEIPNDSRNISCSKILVMCDLYLRPFFDWLIPMIFGWTICLWKENKMKDVKLEWVCMEIFCLESLHLSEQICHLCNWSRKTITICFMVVSKKARGVILFFQCERYCENLSRLIYVLKVFRVIII